MGATAKWLARRANHCFASPCLSIDEHLPLIDYDLPKIFSASQVSGSLTLKRWNKHGSSVISQRSRCLHLEQKLIFLHHLPIFRERSIPCGIGLKAIDSDFGAMDDAGPESHVCLGSEAEGYQVAKAKFLAL